MATEQDRIVSTRPAWLPELLTLNFFGGDWERYFAVLYSCFKRDFVDSKPLYKGTRLGLKKHPIIQGKEATFWHLISEGKVEEDRVPDMRRCERICWARPIIEHCDDGAVKTWENVRDGGKRILLWLEEFEYLVILSERNGYTLIWTAFTVTRSHQKAKLQREYEAFHRGRNG
jgi:hypothetical protein